jgi:hypothetical protein
MLSSLLQALPASCNSILAETHMAEVSLQYRETVASSTTAGWWYLLIPFAAIGIACVIYYLGTRPPAIVNTPDGMLHELCKVHRINSRGRVLLELIAEEAELDHPASLFISEHTFAQAIEKAGQHVHYDRRKQSTLASLQRQLFDG